MSSKLDLTPIDETLSDEDIKLASAVVFEAAANRGDSFKRRVASTIFNRRDSGKGEFGANTGQIKDVVYHPGAYYETNKPRFKNALAGKFSNDQEREAYNQSEAIVREIAKDASKRKPGEFWFNQKEESRLRAKGRGAFDFSKVSPAGAEDEFNFYEYPKKRNNGVSPNMEIQTKLKASGYYQGAIDGQIGPKTREAIKKFQADKGLTPDGVAGPKTKKALFDLSALNPFDVREAQADEVASDPIKDHPELNLEPVTNDYSGLDLEPVDDRSMLSLEPVKGEIKDKPYSLAERSARGFMQGVAGTVEGGGGALELIGAKEIGGLISERGKELREENFIPDPKFYDQVTAGFGSLSTFFIPGLGVAKGAQALSAVPRLAGWFGIGASSILEAGVEAGSAYQQAQEKFGDEQEAVKTGAKVFWANLPTLVFTNKFGLFGEKGGKIMRTLAASGMEGAQELSQQVISNLALKDPALQGTLESFGVGAITGGGVKAIESTLFHSAQNQGEAVIDEAQQPQQTSPEVTINNTDIPKAGTPGTPIPGGPVELPGEPVKTQATELNPVEKAKQHGEVVGIDATSGLPVIDTTKKPVATEAQIKQTIEGLGGKFLQIQPAKDSMTGKDVIWYNTPSGSTQMVNVEEYSPERVKQKIDTFETAKKTYEQNKKPSAQVQTPTLTPSEQSQKDVIAPSEGNILKQQEGGGLSEIQEGKKGREEVLIPKGPEAQGQTAPISDLYDEQSKKDISDIQGMLASSEGPQTIKTEEGYKRLASGWPEFLTNRGYTKSGLNNIFKKSLSDSTLTERQSSILKDVLESYRALKDNTGAEEIKIDKELAELRNAYPEITDKEILDLQKEVENEWPEERLQAAVKKYSAKKAGSSEGQRSDASSQSEELPAGEYERTPSGQLRPKLEAPIPKSLFHGKGELFTHEKPTAKGSPGASVGSFTEEIAQGAATERTGEVQIKPVAVIEMVKLARLIMGEFPTLKRFPKARGMFYGQGKGSIKLYPDLFKAGQEKQLAATLAHEIGHLVDYLPDSTLKRGNLLGRLASLMNYLKTTLPKLSGQDTESGIITPKERGRIARAVERKIGPRPKEEGPLAEWKKSRSKAYADAINEEANRRGLVQHKDLRKEMIDLSFEWRPIEDSTDEGYMVYRSSSKEIYADAISALLNSPAYVKTKAPLFYEMFFEYLDRKPAFKEQYLYMQQIMQGKPSDLAEIRLEDRRMMFAKGEAMRGQLTKEAEAVTRDTWQNLRQLLDDRFWPIARRLNRQRRDAIVPSSDAVHLLREQGMWQADAYKYAQQIDADAIKPMLESGATTQDLGDYMYLRRVIGKAELDKNTEIAKAINSANEEVINALRAQGYEIADKLTDREQLANPLGYTPESAREALDYLKTKLTPEQWKAVETADKKYREITFKIVQEAVDTGVYNRNVFEKVILPNKDTYATFGVLDYITDNVAAGIKSSKGTLKEIENPFITTTLKTISLIRLIARNKATRATIEELSSIYPDDIIESKRMFNAAGPTGYMKAPQGRGQVKYLVDGKLVSYDVDPYISKSLENDDTQIIEMAQAFNKWSGNSIFRNLVITFNPAFQTFNTVRDFGRSYVNLNALLSTQGKSVSIAEVLKAYYKALPLALKRNSGVSDAQLDEIMAHKALGIPFNDYNVDARDDGFARILRKYKVIGDNMEAKTTREKLIKGWTQIDSAVRFVGNVIETLPKVAGYNVLKEKGVSDRELGYLTRTYLGTPDIQTSGKWTRLTNQLFTFSNVTIQGAKSDIRLAINPTTRAGWHWANFKISVLPVLAMSAAILGFMGKELEDWFEKVPEFDKTNYIIIPIGVDNDDRAKYIRVPHNQTSRILAAILYKMLTAQKNKVDGFGGAVDVTASQLPSLAPLLTTLGAWGAFMQGQNPQDMFRGRTILSEQAFTAGGLPALEKMVQYTFNNYGFSQFTTYDDRRNTTFEATIQATPFLSAITRIVKTTDYGLVEKARVLSKESSREIAQRNILRAKLFDEQLRGFNAGNIGAMLDREGSIKTTSKLKETLRGITDKLYSGKAEKDDYRTTEKAFIRHALKEYGDPWISSFLSAQSKETKIKVLTQAKDSMKIERYNTIVNKLRKAGIISREMDREIKKSGL